MRSRRLRRLLALLAIPALALGCGAVPTGNDDVDEMVNALCEEHGAICVGTSTKELVDLGVDDSFYWGRYSWGEVELPGATLEYGLVCYDDRKCAEDLTVCAGVVLHEIGHQKTGPDQSGADCWAVAHATPAQGQALADLVCTFNDRPRCAAVQECLQ